MTRSVIDAAIVLAAIVGADSADPATANAPVRQAGFSFALEGAGLQGRRLGIVRNHGGGPAGEPILELAVATLIVQGVEVVDPVVLRPSAEYAEDELAVLLYEFKADLAAYLTRRATHPQRSLADIIAFNEREATAEMGWFGQELFLEADKKDGLDSRDYRDKAARIQRLAGQEGIDAALAANRLDALVAITCSPAWSIDLLLGDNGAATCSTSPAAVAGYPSVSVPAGFVHGLPVGVSFFAGAWKDAEVLGIAHAFEKAHAARRPPSYLETVAYDSRSALEEPVGD